MAKPNQKPKDKDTKVYTLKLLGHRGDWRIVDNGSIFLRAETTYLPFISAAITQLESVPRILTEGKDGWKDDRWAAWLTVYLSVPDVFEF